MTFELTIHGESPAELLAALQQLSITPQPQDTPAPQPEKQDTARQQPENTRPEAQANSTADEAAASASAAVAAPEPSTHAPTPDPVSLDKIRDLSRSLIVHGKRNEVQQIIKGTGASSVTKLPPDCYTEVWEKLVTLSGEVDEDAAG